MLFFFFLESDVFSISKLSTILLKLLVKWREAIISPIWLAEASPWDGVRAKCIYAHPGGDNVGLRPWDLLGHHVLLPTKTSRSSIQLFRRSILEDKTFSQVFTAKVVNPLLRAVVWAIILSSVSLVLIVWYHRVLISWGLCTFSWITLSQRRTHIKKADSEMRIWRRRAAPLW